MFLCQRAGMIRHFPASKPDNRFTVELWTDDETRPLEQLAVAANFHLAKAAFDEAVRRMPGKPILIRHGIRVVLESRMAR